jgi:hypothetical protein
MYIIQVTFDQEEGRDIFADVQADPGFTNHTHYVETSLEATKALATIIAEGFKALRQEGTINIYERTNAGEPSRVIYHVEIFHDKIEITE